MGKKKYHKHHIIPRSQETDEINPHVEDNVVKMERDLHSAHHLLYKNKTPQEQLKQFLEGHWKVISHETRTRLALIMSMSPRDFYNESVLK